MIELIGLGTNHLQNCSLSFSSMWKLKKVKRIYKLKSYEGTNKKARGVEIF